MVGKAFSETKKKQIQAKKQEEALADAIRIAQAEEEKPKKERQAMREICREVEKRWQQKSGYGGITVDQKTVKRRMDGGQSSCQFNMETNGWLTKGEEENLVEFCLDYGM
ncbi:hypothetical protein BS17DRAFT_150322 [Gyrodon lividus]|nr:hypothetical protein BS17DRAFT_150322 [Gyrodon lividus]